MFCKNCGKEIDDKANVCIHCGVATANPNTQPANSQQSQVVNVSLTDTLAPKSNGFAVAGFILSFLGGILGLIFSIVGLQRSKQPEYNGNGKGLAIAGIIISCIELFGYIIGIGICTAGACALGGAAGALPM